MFLPPGPGDLKNARVVRKSSRQKQESPAASYAQKLTSISSGTPKVLRRLHPLRTLFKSVRHFSTLTCRAPRG